MKTKSKLALCSLLLCASTTLLAQTDVDALRYSGSSVTGTARFTAMSGAFGALGGDFTSLSYNPAGIAIYRTSEFTFTPSIYLGSTSSSFLGRTDDEKKYNFNFGNIGLIYTRMIPGDQQAPGWKSWNFGLGYNRLDNFHNRSFYQGTNPENSLLDNFAQNARGIDPDHLDQYYEWLAYQSFMINPDSLNNYSSVIPNGGEIQRRSTETRGAIGETVFTFGGNYSNKFYLGATLGFKNLRYVETTTYEENDPDSAIPSFRSFKFDQDVTTRGTGFDFKLGMIYRPNDLLRFGIAVTTPSWYSMHDDYKNSLAGDTGTVLITESPDGSYDYELSTPFKAMFSMGLIFGNKGLISADYTFSDYSESRFDADGSPFSDVNNFIRDKYSEVHNLRIGTEWVYQDLSFRLGTSLTTSPIDKAYKVGSSDFSKKSYSGGIGFRDDGVFIDIGYAYTVSDEYFQPYTLQNEDVPGVKTRVTSNNFVVTLGVKF